jgi:excinuclease ABC subunit A
MPWKVLGRKWHLMRKGFPSAKRVSWKPEVLERLFATLEEVLPDGAVDWSNKQVVYFRRHADGDVWAAVHTKRRDGVDLSLFGETGQVPLGRIAELGAEREIKPHRDGREAASIRIKDARQAGSPELREFLVEHVQGNDSLARARSAHVDDG